MCVGGKGVAHTGKDSGWKLLTGKIPVVEISMSRFQPFTCTQNTAPLRQPGCRVHDYITCVCFLRVKCTRDSRDRGSGRGWGSCKSGVMLSACLPHGLSLWKTHTVCCWRESLRARGSRAIAAFPPWPEILELQSCLHLFPSNLSLLVQ